MREPLDHLTLLSLFFFFLTFIQTQIAAVEDNLQPPHPVATEAHTTNSVTLSWKLPPNHGIDIEKISIHYCASKTDKWETISVFPNMTSKMITDLKPGTNYTAFITAHYSNKQTVSTEKFIMSTLESVNDSNFKECLCFKPGTKGCEKQATVGGRCVCHKGYEGLECDSCSEGFYQDGDKCIKCSCSPETSTGTCKIGADINEIVCICNAGYFGSMCDNCHQDYYPVEQWCVPCTCLYCQERYTSDCDLCPSYAGNVSSVETVTSSCGLDNPIPRPTINHEDGTVAIVAVIVSLAFIACVAGAISCYRRCLQARNQPPFWSIELAEDKISLNAGSDYQRLERASKQNLKSGHQRSSSVVEATVAQRAVEQPQYNCISI